jgi:hypothetical protein
VRTREVDALSRDSGQWTAHDSEQVFSTGNYGRLIKRLHKGEIMYNRYRVSELWFDYTRPKSRHQRSCSRVSTVVSRPMVSKCKWTVI